MASASTTIPPSSSSCSLSPSSPPFIFPRSYSPTSTSHSDSNSATTICSAFTESPSTSTDTSHSAHHSADDKPKAKGNILAFSPSSLTAAPNTKAKSFGAGWKSSSSPLFSKMKDTFLPPQDAFAVRPRSPSLPIFSQVADEQPHTSGGLFPMNTDPFSSSDVEYHSSKSPYSHTHRAPSFSPASPFPTSPTDSIRTSSLQRHPSISTIDIELDDHSNFPAYSSAGLLHHQSVPNLPFIQPSLGRRPSGTSVRFKEDFPDVPEGAEAKAPQRALRRMPAINWGQMGMPRTKLGTSKSMPVIQMVGERRNVFIHRVNDNLTEEDLREYASELGDVVSVKIPNRTTKPHAFVMFKKSEQAQRFISHLKMRNVECEFGKEDYQVQNKALEDPNSANLYIAGLPTTMTYDELAKLLYPGVICSWKPLIDEANNRRGPVMARLQTRPQAEDVIRRLNGKHFPGMSERLQVRIADSDLTQQYTRQEQKHYKRQQTVWRDRAPPGQLEQRQQMRTEIIGPAQGGAPQLPDLLHTREYLASQLQAIDHKLARTNISLPFPTEDPHDYTPHDFTNQSVNVIIPAQTQTPWPENGSRHRHTSSNFSSETLATWPDHWPPSPSIIGPAPQSWTRAGLAFHPFANQSAAVDSFPHGMNAPGSGRLRQPAASFGSLAQTTFGLSGQGDSSRMLSSPAVLHHVRSSPELGGGRDSATKLLWKDGA